MTAAGQFDWSEMFTRPARTPNISEWDTDIAYRPAWHEFALCKGRQMFATLDQDRVFNGSGDQARRQRHDPYIAQRRLCRNCPVRQTCLDYALERNERFGVWGGLDPEERRELRKERAA